MSENKNAVRPKISHVLVEKLIGKEYMRAYLCGACGGAVGPSEPSCKSCGAAQDWSGIKFEQKGRKRR